MSTYTDDFDALAARGARRIARAILTIGIPGTEADWDAIAALVRDGLPGEGEFALGAFRRARRLVEEVVADPRILLQPTHSDLCPDELIAQLRHAFRACFPEVATAARVDEAGQMFFPADALADALDIDHETLRDAAAAGPQPVGVLRRVQ